ncbi:unnamed protein product [Caenorhabditis auriculariae]|uniref:Uncharacterized protein n=1 Tax=Caenorhabditis auriculariae TaxID=2777116 RepID=A0A8S1GUC4_9PELO|nr:unnamed protein product [Caenorhabditis auriculariae]
MSRQPSEKSVRDREAEEPRSLVRLMEEALKMDSHQDDPFAELLAHDSDYDSIQSFLIGSGPTTSDAQHIYHTAYNENQQVAMPTTTLPRYVGSIAGPSEAYYDYFPDSRDIWEPSHHQNHPIVSQPDGSQLAVLGETSMDHSHAGHMGYMNPPHHGNHYVENIHDDHSWIDNIDVQPLTSSGHNISSDDPFHLIQHSNDLEEIDVFPQLPPQSVTFILPSRKRAASDSDDMRQTKYTIVENDDGKPKPKSILKKRTNVLKASRKLTFADEKGLALRHFKEIPTNEGGRQHTPEEVRTFESVIERYVPAEEPSAPINAL